MNRSERQGMEQVRIRAVKQVKSGVGVRLVARALGVSRVAVYSWVRTYDAGGEDALRSRKARGASPRLTANQMAKLRKLIVGSDPRQLRF